MVNVASLRETVRLWRERATDISSAIEVEAACVVINHCIVEIENLRLLNAHLRADGKEPNPPSGCPLGYFCQEHDCFHGGEAEELRKGIELLVSGGVNSVNVNHRLHELLDEVDARDSVAWHEYGKKRSEWERIMRHTVGYPRMYRNHFATAPDCDNWQTVQDMVKAGLMEPIPVNADDFAGMRMFRVVPAQVERLKEQATK